jgi:hypothetical protein
MLASLQGGHELYAASYLFYAASDVIYAIGGSLYYLRVEQSQLDIQECLKHHYPSSSDDEDDAPMAEDD